MTELLDLCYDVLIRILEETNPADLAACAQTSVGFNEFLKKNTRLYKAQYLKAFVSSGVSQSCYRKADLRTGRPSSETERSGA